MFFALKKPEVYEKAFMLTKVSIDMAAYYCKVVKGGFSEIRRKIVTQDVHGCNRLHAGALS